MTAIFAPDITLFLQQCVSDSPHEDIWHTGGA